jgi:hypothetical protein
LVENSSGTTAADYTLTEYSPAIDRGATIAAVTDDYAGTARPQGGAYDIGAYEESYSESDLGESDTVTNTIYTAGTAVLVNNATITLNNDTIAGLCYVSEDATAKNVIFYGPVALAATKTLTATYCSFMQSEAEIEAAGGTVGTKTGCVFSTNPRFVNAAGTSWYQLLPLNSAVWKGGDTVVGLESDITGMYSPLRIGAVGFGVVRTASGRDD